MKIAITSSNKDLSSMIDERFGRCNFFYIYDTESSNGEFLENFVKDDKQGVGSKIVEYLANLSVNEIYAVEVGEKAKPLLDKLKIKINIAEKNTPLIDIINNLKK